MHLRKVGKVIATNGRKSMYQRNTNKLRMIALLGVLLTVVLVSGCTQVPEEEPAEGQTKATSLDNPGQSLTSILSKYQGMNVRLVFLGGQDWEGTLKEVNANYIVVETRAEETQEVVLSSAIPISHIAGVLIPGERVAAVIIIS